MNYPRKILKILEKDCHMQSFVKFDNFRLKERLVEQILPFFTQNIPKQVRNYGKAVKMQICFTILFVAAATGKSLHSAMKKLSMNRQKKEKIMQKHLRIFDPDMPKPTHIRQTLARWPVRKIKSRFKVLNSLLIKELRSSDLYRRLHGGRGKSKRKLAAAFDITEIPFSGTNKQLKTKTTGTRSKGAGGQSFCYLTLQLVCPGLRLVIGVRPIHDDSPDLGRMMTLMLRRAKREGISIGRIYLDRGFFQTRVLKEIKDNFSEIKTVMPVVRNSRIKNKIQEWYEENGYEAGMFDVYFGPEGKPNVWYKVIVRPKSKERRENQYKNTRKKQPVDEDGNELVYNDFIYFCVVRPPKELDDYSFYDVFRQIMLEYRRRWGIETGYKQIKSLWAKTTSIHYSIRLFLVLTAFLSYNIWVLENLHMIDQSIDDGMPDDYTCCHTPTNEDVEAYDYRILKSKMPKYARTTKEYPHRTWQPRPVDTTRNMCEAFIYVIDFVFDRFLSEFDKLELDIEEDYDPPRIKKIKDSVPVF